MTKLTYMFVCYFGFLTLLEVCLNLPANLDFMPFFCSLRASPTVTAELKFPVELNSFSAGVRN